MEREFSRESDEIQSRVKETLKDYFKSFILPSAEAIDYLRTNSQLIDEEAAVAVERRPQDAELVEKLKQRLLDVVKPKKDPIEHIPQQAQPPTQEKESNSEQAAPVKQ